MACLAHVRKEWAETQDGGHDTVVLSRLEVLEARPGYVKARLQIQKHNVNNHGTTHGGCIMSLVDSVTWLALASLGAPVVGSVSTNMSNEFVKPCGAIGDYLYAEGVAVQQGRRLAFTRVTFSVNGKTTAFGSHTMALSPVDIKYRFSSDGKDMIPVEAKAKI